MFLSRSPRVALLALIVALAPAALVAQKKDDKKAQDQQANANRHELMPLVRGTDEVMKGGAAGTWLVSGSESGQPAPQAQAAPGDVPLTWRNDYIKATDNLIYVPFTITVEPGRLTGSSLAVYLRVAPKGLTQPHPPAAKKDEKKDDKKAAAAAGPTEYPFETFFFTDLKTPAQGLAPRFSRSFAVPAGEYDVYLALRERAQTAKDNDPPAKVAIIKQTLTIPDFWSTELTTSSVILADRVDTLTAALAPEVQAERPYILGTTEIVPAIDDKFKKTEELTVMFFVYGASPDAGTKKPDVKIEYIFHRRENGAEKKFNETNPILLNATTLPAAFDYAAGHPLVGAQGVPLASFPEGDYRLELKITDNKSGKSLTRDVLFTVTS